jgi:hypothetical protein
MTMRGWLHLLSDLRASFGDDALVHELPLGVLEANRIRVERVGSMGGVAPGKATLGVAAYPSAVAPSPELLHPSTARTRRAE